MITNVAIPAKDREGARSAPLLINSFCIFL